MPPMERRQFSWPSLVAAVSKTVATASAITANMGGRAGLIATSDSCAANFAKCTTQDFPDYFCCPSQTTCLSFAANTTLVCCPKGQDCSVIVPITCDLTMQDGRKNPKGPIKTTALSGTLPTCGNSQCCPFGYSCSREGHSAVCVENQDQSMAPHHSTASSVASKTATSSMKAASTKAASTTTTKPTSSTIAATLATESAASSRASKKGAATGVIVGLLGGLALLVTASIFFFRWRKTQKGGKRNQEGRRRSFGNMISKPMVQDGAALRSDFARKSLPTDSTSSGDSDRPCYLTNTGGPGYSDTQARNVSAQAARHHGEVSSMSGDEPVSPRNVLGQCGYDVGCPYGQPSNERGHAASSIYPPTPSRQRNPQSAVPHLRVPGSNRDREPSRVSINVFADPDFVPRPDDNKLRRRDSDAAVTTLGCLALEWSNSNPFDNWAAAKRRESHGYETVYAPTINAGRTPARDLLDMRKEKMWPKQ